MSNAPESPFQVPNKWEGLIVGSLGFTTYFVSLSFFNEGRATLVGITCVAFCGSIRICYPIFKLIWFWILMFSLLSLHCILIASFRWEMIETWTGIELIPIAIADTILILAFAYFCFRFLYGRPAKLAADDPDETIEGEF